MLLTRAAVPGTDPAKLYPVGRFSSLIFNYLIDLLISGKTRVKVLTKFFLAPDVSGHLRGLAEEFGESTNAIRLELNRFERGGLLTAGMERNRKVFRANPRHPLFSDLSSIVRKHVGLDHLVDQVLAKIGDVTEAYVTGEMALGRDAGRIDLVLVGDRINRENLERLAAKAGKLINRTIACTVVSTREAPAIINGRTDVWKIWG